MTKIIGMLVVAAVTLGVACHTDLGVESRQFECQGDNDCLSGWTCSSENLCVRQGSVEVDAGDTRDAEDVATDTAPLLDAEPSDTAQDAADATVDAAEDAADTSNPCEGVHCDGTQVCDPETGACVDPPECVVNSDCSGSGEQCVTDAEGVAFCCAAIGVPENQCDPICQTGCDVGEACRASYDESTYEFEGWVCKPAGDGLQGEPCGGVQDCAAGFTCGSGATPQGECQEICRMDIDNWCSTGTCNDTFLHDTVGSCGEQVN
ncbi:hypothetical protein FIV42_20985 [Persicimonas caeni]|uniref:Uncharacterized protein n=1 Tax=Persicimonas caeni TaxID=2292766 RepID=A0A4Y6PXT2_PERCE|nr:hypothetical protein [Persicimonas caeni]QDG53126.1 hypothetical protein FIV42_20985 [Persicimonas caeni]QED34348.1 hypothetical protein FRD00_20980 [Persicimonas caeni]